MFNTIITTVKTLLRRPSTWVWGAIFPIALSTMFMFMFANLSSDGKIDPVPVAIVADEAWDASTFKDVAASLAKEGDDQLLDVSEYEDLAAARKALKSGKVAGIYTVDAAGTPRLTLLSSYDARAPRRCSPTAASLRRWQARIRKMPRSCPRLPKTTRRRSPTPRRLRALCRSRAAPAV